MDENYKIVPIYLHSNKERMIEIGKTLNLNENALEMFKNGLSEIEIICRVELKTGLIQILSAKEI